MYFVHKFAAVEKLQNKVLYRANVPAALLSKSGVAVILLLVRCELRQRLRIRSKRSKSVCNWLHRYGNTHAIWDHTVLPATRQR